MLVSVPQDILLQMNADNPFMTIVNMASFTSFMNSYSFGNPNVQKLIHSTDQHFDVVINEEFFADSWLMFAHKFKAPIITICEYIEMFLCLQIFECLRFNLVPLRSFWNN